MDAYDKNILQQESAFNADTSLLKNVSTGANPLYTNGLRTGVIPTPKTAPTPGVIGSFNTNTPADTGIRGTQRAGQGLRASTTPTAQNTYDANFAREAKRVITKRGLTRAQRATQLGVLESENTLRAAGVSEDDPAARAIRDLNRQSTRRGLTASQRSQLQDVSGDILKNVTGGKSAGKKPAETFEDTLIKLIDEMGVDK